MKYVYANHKALAEAWASGALACEATVYRASSMKANRDEIFSWGEHFMIAKRLGDTVLFTERVYSHSTSKHKSIVLRAARYTVIPVPELESVRGLDSIPPAVAKGWADEKILGAGERLQKVPRARVYGKWHAKDAFALLGHAASLCRMFGAEPPVDQAEALLRRYRAPLAVLSFKMAADGEGKLEIPEEFRGALREEQEAA